MDRCSKNVRLMGAKIRGIFRTCKMFNKNISIISFFVSYIISNQCDNINNIYIYISKRRKYLKIWYNK